MIPLFIEHEYIYVNDVKQRWGTILSTEHILTVKTNDKLWTERRIIIDGWKQHRCITVEWINK